MNHRKHSGGRTCGSMGNLNVDIELLVQTTQSSAMQYGRKSSGEKFHGWLWKKSGRFSKWRNQHFVLEGALLSYYDTFPTDQFVADSSLTPLAGDNLFSCKGESSPAGAMRVAHVETSKKSKIAFKVYAVSGKIIDLRAKNEQVCNQWVERLMEASVLAKRQETTNNSTTSTASSSLSVGYSDSELDLIANIVDKSGWLDVGDKKSKRKRYCVLQGSMFTIYDTEDAWAVPLSRAYVSRVEKYDIAACELLVTTTAGKTNKVLIVKTKSPDEMHLWLEAFTHACNAIAMAAAMPAGSAAGNLTGSDLADITTEVPLLHLEFRYRQVDTVLAVAYAIACFFAFWAFAIHTQSPSNQAATLGFYLLIALASFTRVVWFATPFGLDSVLVKPQRLMIGDEGSVEFLVAELVELLGSFFIYSIFVLIVVFWADMLRRLFTHESVRSHPLRIFAIVLASLMLVQAVGFAVFLMGRADSFWLMLFDDLLLCLLSFGSLVAVLIYSFRMKTVLQAFLEVSQIDTTDRIKAVNWATSICAFFLVVNSLFLGYSIVSLAKFHEVGVFFSSSQWWIFVASKHLVEILVMYFLLYTLWGKSSEEKQTKQGYEAIPDVLSDDEAPSAPNSNTALSTPNRH
ncbi:TPA: hypothetical protein N0F65_004940 [Lagenidium giganteum]|uniref:PH domain-containing protein n=1 Tax=Lagenidium giganteum TaxID=4803 RepID=A0AAV2YYR2_9STRA|nr:TPA: hypothetical protein N0F65_004940 [Lagenidium giganteum]